MSNLENRVILITGAASGIGRLLATGSAARGASVVACDINEDELQLTVSTITDNGGKAIGIRTDVTNIDDMYAAVKQGIDAFGQLDILVNNAGIMPLALYADHAIANKAWSRCIDINMKGVVNGISAAYDPMLERGKGHIVNISSIYGNYPTRGANVYGATKAAVNYLSESLRQETQGKIKVTTVRPTAVPNTSLSEGVINPEASMGLMGNNGAEMMERMVMIEEGKGDEAWFDTSTTEYLLLEAENLVEQIMYAIDQPWGVSISDLTIRASGDVFVV